MSERHPGDLLSALLDGELDVAEADQVEAHVRGCDRCRDELAATAEARSVVRALPPVAAPSWLDTITDRRWSSRQRIQAAGSVVASVVVLALAIGGIAPSQFRPEPDTAVDRHAATVAALGVATGRSAFQPATPSTAKSHDLSSLDAPLRRPPEVLGDYRLVEAYDAGSALHLLYRSGEFGLSVFESPGQIDWGSLPAGEGTRMSIDGRDAWRWDGAPARGRVVVYEDDGLVVTVVADEPGTAAMAIAELIPDPRDLTMRQRIERALTRAVRALAPA